MKKYEIVIQDDKGNTLQTISAKHKTLTNKEAHKIIEAYKQKLENSCSNQLDKDIEAFDLAIKALEEVKGLRLLIDWAVECDFGYDNIPEEYEKYKEEISDMRYTEGLIYIAKREAENE